MKLFKGCLTSMPKWNLINGSLFHSLMTLRKRSGGGLKSVFGLYSAIHAEMESWRMVRMGNED